MSRGLETKVPVDDGGNPARKVASGMFRQALGGIPSRDPGQRGLKLSGRRRATGSRPQGFVVRT